MKKRLEELNFNLNEIFYSIQGEGSRIGKRCLFIRLQGCLLRCVWCDTPYALERKKEEILISGDKLYDKIKQFDCKFIMLTGGEPLEQEDIFDFIEHLCDNHYEVVIETNGQADVSRVDKRAFKIIDFKCPGSKMHKKNNLNNIKFINKEDEIKFVVNDKIDYEWAKNFILEHKLIEKTKEIIFSPVFENLEPIRLAEMILKDNLNVRMQLQLHKYIWEPQTRGV